MQSIGCAISDSFVRHAPQLLLKRLLSGASFFKWDIAFENRLGILVTEGVRDESVFDEEADVGVVLRVDMARDRLTRCLLRCHVDDGRINGDRRRSVAFHACRWRVDVILAISIPRRRLRKGRLADRLDFVDERMYARPLLVGHAMDRTFAGGVVGDASLTRRTPRLALLPLEEGVSGAKPNGLVLRMQQVFENLFRGLRLARVYRSTVVRVARSNRTV